MLVSNYVYARASTAFVLPMPVLFAFPLHCFLRYFFGSIAIISRVYRDSNFLVYFLLCIKDRVKVGAIEVDIVAGT
jgi:hypothetical protein